MQNVEIRDAMKRKGLYGYQVAAELGITETSFSRMLARADLTDPKKTEVMEAIDRAELKRSGQGSGQE